MENNDLQQENLVREISYSLSRAAGWMKFLGIGMIVYGGILALTIIGLVIAWLPIWVGVLVYKAAKSSLKATEFGDKDQLISALRNINNYFIIAGIMFIIGIIMGILIWLVLMTTNFALQDLDTYL